MSRRLMAALAGAALVAGMTAMAAAVAVVSLFTKIAEVLTHGSY